MQATKKLTSGVPNMLTYAAISLRAIGPVANPIWRL